MVSAGFSVVSAFVVARLIGPAEVGVGAAGVAAHVLLWVGVNALFADAIVQSAELDDQTSASAFWASALVGVAAAVVQAFAGWPLAWALGDDRLVPMSLLLAIPLPLVGAAGVIQGRVTRQRRYRLLAARALIGQGLGTLVGIASALAGAGAWALAAQQAVTSGCGALALLFGAGWWPAPTLRWRRVRQLLQTGVPLTASTLVLHGRYRMFAVLIGGTAGAASLGQVHLAFRLVDTVRELVSTALWRLMLPDMAQFQGDPVSLRAGVDRWLAGSALVLFPLCGAMLLSVEPLTRLLLGPAWAASGRAALPLIGLAAYLFLVFPAGVAVVARGAPHVALRGNLATALLLAIGVVVLRPASATQAVAIWVAAQALAAPFVLLMGASVLGSGAWRLIRAGLPTLIAAGIAAVAAFSVSGLPGMKPSPLSMIAGRLLVSAAVYALCVVVVRLVSRLTGKMRFGIAHSLTT